MDRREQGIEFVEIAQDVDRDVLTADRVAADVGREQRSDVVARPAQRAGVVLEHAQRGDEVDRVVELARGEPAAQHGDVVDGQRQLTGVRRWRGLGGLGRKRKQRNRQRDCVKMTR
jgi:hypothetical protein